MRKLAVPPSEYEERIEKCKEKAIERGFDGLLVYSHTPDKPGNVRYLTNYSSPVSLHNSNLPDQPVRRTTPDTCLVLPIEGEPVLIKMPLSIPPDGFVTTIPIEIATKDVREYKRDITETIAQVVKEKGLEKKKIGIAGEDVISAHLMRIIKEKLPEVKFEYADDILYKLRVVKSQNEIALMRKTGEMADKFLKIVIESIKPGVKMENIFGLTAEVIMKNGAERLNFIDVCAGQVQHWYNGKKVFEDGDLVMVDFGFVDPNGYFADVARTFTLGEADAQTKDLVRLSHDTNNFIAEQAIPGIRGQEWLEKTRAFVKKGLKAGKYNLPLPDPVMFLAHSIGLDGNSYFFDSEANMELKENMSLAIENFTHVPGFNAARFENLAIVTNNGADFLTKYRYEA
jgi:Xaa-Pro aminopeptidase